MMLWIWHHACLYFVYALNLKFFILCKVTKFWVICVHNAFMCVYVLVLIVLGVGLVMHDNWKK
jgi:hypothetical protein